MAHISRPATSPFCVVIFESATMNSKLCYIFCFKLKGVEPILRKFKKLENSFLIIRKHCVLFKAKNYLGSLVQRNYAEDSGLIPGWIEC